LLNVRQLATLIPELRLWRHIVWPERKPDWAWSAVGLIFGAVASIANLLLRLVSARWLLIGFALGMVTAVPCAKLVRKAINKFDDDRSEDAKIDTAVQCWWCTTFRTCLFFCLAVLIANETPIGKLTTDAITARLTSMDAKLTGISTGVGKIESEMGKIKQETSADPHKELANRGVLWTVDAFFEALRGGNEVNVKLFLDGHMTTDVPDSEGRPLPVILALNTTNAPAMLDLLIAGGLDVNHAYEVAGALHTQRMTLLSRAIEKGSAPLIEALIKHHVDVNSAIQTFGAMGMTRDTNPLAAAIYWKQPEIAQLLLDAGANPAAGDYAAYREAQALRAKSNGDPELRGRLDALLERLKPRGAAATRIEDTLRLQGIEQQLNQVALASLRTLPGSPERRKLDAEYDQLQIERTKLRNSLNTAGQLPPP
jgi:hypothetical protein